MIEHEFVNGFVYKKLEKIELEYINEKNLNINDFLKSIKTDLLSKILKNICFVYDKEEIEFTICFNDHAGNEISFCFFR